jgi:glyoxylase-like metal-dependent hydrolase (beta-lactamase superfamily II)
MSDKNHRFKVGKFTCTAVLDGVHLYEHPGSLLCANAPQGELAEALARHGIDLASWTEWASPYPGLVIDTGVHKVLVDTGAGGSLPGTGELIRNMHAAGIAPGEIDVVILTHGHADHAGGNVDREGKPAFPNARYVTCQAEWDLWAPDEPDLSALPFPEELIQLMIQVAHANLLAIEDRFELVGGETEIVPGVRVLPAPGHTPGHLAVAATSDGEELLCLGDAVLHPVHIEQTGWYAAVDLEPERALASRQQLLKRASAHKSLVHAFHFDFPGLGRIVPRGDAWAWQPIAGA